MQEIISLVNGSNSARFVEQGLTELFFDEKEAEQFAIETRSYYYPAKHAGMIVFCVPK